MTISQYERGKLALKAFKLLQGWSTTSPTPNAEKLEDRLPTPWSWSKRKEMAEQLVEWAIGNEPKGNS